MMAAASDRTHSTLPGRASIAIAGDWAPIRLFRPIIESGPEAVYGDTLPLLRQADLRIVNCECTLTAVEAPVWKSGAVFDEEQRCQLVMNQLSLPFGAPDGPAGAWNAYLDHYGIQSFGDEVRGILEKLRTEPRKAAAMFRNRITTPQHSERWKDLLTRLMADDPAAPSSGLPASASGTRAPAAHGLGSRTRAGLERAASRAARSASAT